MSHKIPIDALQPGMVIVQITQQYGPVRIRKSGLVTSQEMVVGLREMGVAEVAIDPEQTVELLDATLSQTQFLLRGNQVSNLAGTTAKARRAAQPGSQHAAGAQLSEQFNRNLLLPTVGDIPEIWQIYLQRSALFVAAAGLGVALGFGGYLGQQQWLSQPQPPHLAVVAHSATPSSQAAGAEAPAGGGADNTGNDSNASNTSGQQLPATAAPVAVGVAADAATSGEMAIPAGQQSAPQQPALQQPEVTAATEFGFYVNDQGRVVPTAVAAEHKEADRPRPTADGGSRTATAGVSSGDNGLPRVAPEDAPAATSAAIKQRVQQVMAAMQQQQEQSAAGEQAVPTDAGQAPESAVSGSSSKLPRVDQMPGWVLTSLPRLSFSTHMYVSEPSERWVKVNNIELREGDWIEDDLQITEIKPQQVVLNFRGREFTMRALAEW